jgi:hypothetical protein
LYGADPGPNDVIVLRAHGCYVNPYAETEATTVGLRIVESARHEMPAEQFAAALKDLGLETDAQLWYVASELLKRMGFHIW